MSNNIEENLLQNLDLLNNQLENYLNDCNVTVSSKTLASMIRNLDKTVSIRKSKKYYGLEIDENGYVKNLVNIDGIIERQEIPKDILRGYYRYDKGNIVLDEKMRQKLWG